MRAKRGKVAGGGTAEGCVAENELVRLLPVAVSKSLPASLFWFQPSMHGGVEFLFFHSSEYRAHLFKASTGGADRSAGRHAGIQCSPSALVGQNGLIA